MKIILLSGGEGKRLFPLSNSVRSKQFLRVLQSPEGCAESMLQRVVRQIRQSMPQCELVIATAQAQRGMIERQVGRDAAIVTEPSRRDTFPAIALASTFLASEQNCSRDEVVVVMPCDAYTDKGYFATVKRMAQAVENNAAQLVLMGIKPTYASTKFGYVLPVANGAKDILAVERFTEKPDEVRAAQFIARGAMWNGGVFAFRLGYITDIVERYTGGMSFGQLRAKYDILPKISFDYEVAEKAASVAAVPFEGMWKDLGTWNALAQELPRQISGYALADEDCDNTTVVNELGIPVLCLGAKNMIVAAAADGILVCDKAASEHIKDCVAKIAPQHDMYREFEWGSRRVLEYRPLTAGRYAVTSAINIAAGYEAAAAEDDRADITWTVVEGTGVVTSPDKCTAVAAGCVVKFEQHRRYTVRAEQNLQIIEVAITSSGEA